MFYCACKLIGNLKLFHKSNRTHFAWVYRRGREPTWDVGRTLEKLVFSRVLPTSNVDYYAGIPLESVVYCLSI